MILDRFRLDGQVAVVTGAGRGIGAASALALAEAGCDVVAAARTADQLGEVAAGVEGAGRRCLCVPGDLFDLDHAASLASSAVEAFGRIDVVVNNVGGTAPRGFLDTSSGYLERAFRFNVGTAHALTRAAAPHLLSAGGAVINLSSAMAHGAGRGYLAYGTAKAALAHYTRLAAHDLAPRVRVNAVAVGTVATSALDVVIQSDELRHAVEAATPLRRLGLPEEVAAAIVFLASPAAAFVTGTVLHVDGGASRPTLDLEMPDL